MDAFHSLNRLNPDDEKRVVLDLNVEGIKHLLRLQDGDSRRSHFHYLLAEPVCGEGRNRQKVFVSLCFRNMELGQ